MTSSVINNVEEVKTIKTIKQGRQQNAANRQQTFKQQTMFKEFKKMAKTCLSRRFSVQRAQSPQ